MVELGLCKFALLWKDFVISDLLITRFLYSWIEGTGSSSEGVHVLVPESGISLKELYSVIIALKVY